jgi:hypothetical protein
VTRIHQPEIADILCCWETQVLVLGQGERCYYRRPREVTRVALKIVLLVVNASILSFKSTAAILPQSPDNPGTFSPIFRYCGSRVK